MNTHLENLDWPMIEAALMNDGFALLARSPYLRLICLLLLVLNIVNTLFNRMNVEDVSQAKAVIFVVVVVVIAYFQLRATRSKEIEA